MNEEPLILGLDTSHLKGSVALAKGGEILCEVLFDASDTHSATLLPAADTALKTAGVKLEAIEIFCVVTGPGSFTGLRIGLATIKGFAAVRGRPVRTANSLEVLAAAFPFAAFAVAPVIDARRGEVYFGLYETGSGIPLEIMEPAAAKPDKLPSLVKDKFSGPVILAGTGAGKAAPFFNGDIRTADSFRSIPRASLLISITSGRDFVPYRELSGLEPLYIRPPDAMLPSGARLKKGGGDR